MSQDRFSNPKYLNWVKVKLYLQYAREGLGPVTEHKVQKFYNDLCSRLQTPSGSYASSGPITCNLCLKSDLKRQWSSGKYKCIGGICDRWLGLLHANHVNPTFPVDWDNLDVSMLPVSTWECTKIFLPYGSGKVESAKDIDLAAILTLYLNCRPLASSLQDVTLCEKVKEIRNKLLHSGTMEVERNVMLADVNMVKKLLNDQAFASDMACREAVTKIDELLSGKLELSLNKELELLVLNDDIKNVAANTNAIEQNMDALTDQVQQQYDHLKTEVSDVTKDVLNLKGQLNTADNNIDELQKFAKRLEYFINAYQIDKVDMVQLVCSIKTLATLKVETDKQNEKLVKLEKTLGRHEVTLEQHDVILKHHEGMIVQQKRRLDSFLSIETDSSVKRRCSDPTMGEVESLQQHLISVYKEDCKWENPLTADEDRPVTISQMYVKPEIKLVQQRDQKGSLIKVQQKQGNIESINLSYDQIFYTRKEKNQNIYISGNAGMGKTAFCKQLVYSWCKSIANEEDSAEDFGVLEEFSLLFYLNLRDVATQYHIEEMIRKNILHNATRNYNVSDLLKTEKCLVVLDGLDEWSCPHGADICRGLNKEIPGRNTLHKNCTYLTTTRNWKFEVIHLKSKDYDKHIELCGIGEESSRELAKNTIFQLDPEHKGSISDFFNKLQDKNVTALANVPVLLIQLVTLWYYCKDLGESQVQLYCKMFDLLFELAKKNMPEITSTSTKPVLSDAKLPNCFRLKEESCCHDNAQLLLCLSKMAFMSLLNEKKEDSLVFKSSILEFCGIDASGILLCLKCGIFTQTKVLDNPTGRYKNYSFLNKKLQEFLAAVYLVTSKTIEEDMGQIKKYCSTLDTTLEMGQVFMFVCGMNADLGNELLEHQASIVSSDECVQNYRHSIFCESLINDIQAGVLACITEGASNGLTIDLHLQDYSIDKYTISDILSHFEQEKNYSSIKSVYLFTNECSTEHFTVVLEHLKKAKTLVKFWLRDLSHVVLDHSILASIINNNVGTLKSLCLSRVKLFHQEVFSAVLKCIPFLGALWMGEVWEKRGDVHDSHRQIEMLVAAQTSHLKQLCLELKCPDHEGKCKVLFDLSAHTQLQTLDLQYMCVTNLHAVARSVENVDLWHITIAQSNLRQFIEALAQTSNKVDVELVEVTVTEDNGGPVDLAAYLRDCNKFVVEECDIGQDNTWDCVRFHKK